MTGALVFIELALIIICYIMVFYLKKWINQLENLMSIIDRIGKE